MLEQALEIANYKSKRSYIPETFEIEDWESLKGYVDWLLEQTPNSLEELEAYLHRINELDAIIEEDQAWRYIHMTRDTQSEEKVNSYQFFVTEIMPHIKKVHHQINRKLVENPFFDQLDSEKYQTFKRALKKSIELYREENVALSSKDQSVSQQYGALTGAMSIEHEGKTYTLQQAAKWLESQDRELRKSIWEKSSHRRMQDAEKLETIFDELIQIRHQMALNAGYDTFTTYKFSQLGRFDYQPEDTRAFHDSVEAVVTPMYKALMEERRERLGVAQLMPWDLHVDMFGDEPLKPFEEARELVAKTIQLLARLRPELGEMIALMDRMNYLDLESRVGKAPGGYNYPLMEVGVPFIFMNAAGTHNDVITMLHESGHAVHAFLTRDIELNALKSTPSEVAELAAMSMELLSLDHYGLFYEDEHERTRAKKGQLLRCMQILPWIATVDAFQQWVYDHPDHTRQARAAQWDALYLRFHGDAVNWDGYESIRKATWLRQMHIFDVPFYYIEYAIAQLGAIGIWRNYKQDPQAGLDGYLRALKMGYQRPIPEIYQAAGIRFDFSKAYIQECMEFCLQQYQALKLE